MKEKLIVVAGPTAVGKTKTSVELAKALNGEVISGDSMQIYRKLDIGTAKITKQEMEGIPHHLIDIKDPHESFSAAEFQTRASKLITEINGRGKVPIIAGGTGLYIRAVTHGYEFNSSGSNPEMRKQFEKAAEEQGGEHLHRLLIERNPVAASQIHPNNVRRVIRALEISYAGTADEGGTKNAGTPYELAMVGLEMERSRLYERINERVDLMFKQGLLKEAKWLFDQHIEGSQSVLAIGYKELFPYFRQEMTLDEAAELLKRNSRRYAKRQLTWFKNQTDATWFDMGEKPFHEKFNEILYFVEGEITK
ncbi:tRNA (adenosine(37)-N6)-dimethylallyltransferase MiaA [Fictibacillus aquaticus]|uniref:tRNA dimethylallyltransferase n=1 Tax=Fictibacillus aquaticus TaxID=2021314 RepID=A0A235FBS2_9BACL|nr:tRNA (adenosine(37)-N6)-dimethylallyltransferase MiaA [Fictibacillus aquaticus]OYD58776.1 tRNA (adenosine(37)-N6)-dimethylallyltransferase MiaA [Fictibacillus aquaticus]